MEIARKPIRAAPDLGALGRLFLAQTLQGRSCTVESALPRSPPCDSRHRVPNKSVKYKNSKGSCFVCFDDHYSCHNHCLQMCAQWLLREVQEVTLCRNGSSRHTVQQVYPTVSVAGGVNSICNIITVETTRMPRCRLVQRLIPGKSKSRLQHDNNNQGTMRAVRVEPLPLEC